jgi:hypothetical protein
MREPNRIPVICAELQKLWQKYPDQRLGQILENYIFNSGQRGDKTSVALFYQEDDITYKAMIKENMPEKQKLELLKPYGEYDKDYFHIGKVPPEVAEQLYGDWPNLSAEESFNNSPTMKELVDLTKQYNGTLSGYCIPVESGREDARISFDAIYLKCTKEEAQKLKRKYSPDEFDRKADGSYRFWWD